MTKNQSRAIGLAVLWMMGIVCALVACNATQQPASGASPSGSSPDAAMNTAIAIATPMPTTVPAASPGAVPTATAAANDTRFRAGKVQAELIAIVVNFVNAANNGNVDAALALITDDFNGSDCDYVAVSTVQFRGKEQTAEWIRRRKADADLWQIERIWNENPGETHVAGVTLALRSSNTLRRLGFAEGIKPKLSAKVVAYYEPTRLFAFVLGPGGGDQSFCKP